MKKAADARCEKRCLKAKNFGFEYRCTHQERACDGIMIPTTNRWLWYRRTHERRYRCTHQNWPPLGIATPTNHHSRKNVP